MKASKGQEGLIQWHNWKHLVSFQLYSGAPSSSPSRTSQISRKDPKQWHKLFIHAPKLANNISATGYFMYIL